MLSFSERERVGPSFSFIGSFMAEASRGAISLYVPLQRSTRLLLNSSNYYHRLDAAVKSSVQICSAHSLHFARFHLWHFLLSPKLNVPKLSELN